MSRKLTIILLLALSVRLASWLAYERLTSDLHDQGQALWIWDERDYNTLALNLVRHGEFSFKPGEPTSLRPPLYPALVAGVYAVCGEENYAAVRLLQLALSLMTVLLVYRLGCMTYGPSAGTWAALFMALYPSFLAYDNFLLTETLFTFLLMLFCVLLATSVQRRSWGAPLASGVVLGLAALTRSVLWL
ncbi:MAG: glycosyltransferase family 39 protein, partial [Chloroflexi bacterium]|nr:glycosyltransferase family 39 protein [Chloroflexota bacterium]